MEMNKELLEQIREQEREIKKVTYRMFYNKSRVLKIDDNCIIVLDDVNDYLNKIETNPLKMDNMFMITVAVNGRDYKGKFSINSEEFAEQDLRVLDVDCPYNVILGYYTSKDSNDDVYAEDAYLDFVVYEKPKVEHEKNVVSKDLVESENTHEVYSSTNNPFRLQDNSIDSLIKTVDNKLKEIDPEGIYGNVETSPVDVSNKKQDKIDFSSMTLDEITKKIDDKINEIDPNGDYKYERTYPKPEESYKVINEVCNELLAMEDIGKYREENYEDFKNATWTIAVYHDYLKKTPNTVEYENSKKLLTALADKEKRLAKWISYIM